MNTKNKLVIALGLLASMIIFTPISHAEQIAPVEKPQSYGAKVGDKALHGITNIATGFLEIPKNVINISNADNSNVFFGMTGGAAKGIIDMLGRISAGAADLITAPLPTKPIAQPQYIWQDFDANTTYNDAFRLQENTK